MDGLLNQHLEQQRECDRRTEAWHLAQRLIMDQRNLIPVLLEIALGEDVQTDRPPFAEETIPGSDQ